jgi:hypothetical protein
LFLIILGDGLERLIHLLCFDFYPHEFFARGQIFYRYIHKKAFQLIAENDDRSRIEFPPFSEPGKLGKGVMRVKPAGEVSNRADESGFGVI